MDLAPRNLHRSMLRAPLPTVARAIIALEVILGVGVLFGGGALVLTPVGHLRSMPTSLLAGSPFRDYLGPGAILFIVIGVGPLIAAALPCFETPSITASAR